MTIKNERIDFLDIAKAITIFLVMMGHIGTPDTLFFYRRVIYSFHMPLFLIISGIVTKRKLNTQNKVGPLLLKRISMDY